MGLERLEILVGGLVRNCCAGTRTM